MEFVFYNDTGRTVLIHDATFSHGVKVKNIENNSKIEPFELATFVLPDGETPWVKMWDYGQRYDGSKRDGGKLQILVITR